MSVYHFMSYIDEPCPVLCIIIITVLVVYYIYKLYQTNKIQNKRWKYQPISISSYTYGMVAQLYAFQKHLSRNQKSASARGWVRFRMGLEGTEVGNCVLLSQHAP